MTKTRKETLANIMVVDDTPVNLGLITTILTQHNYYVLSLPNGPRALSVAQNQALDLILLDINMPDMDGYEVCQKLKSNDKTQKIPIIFISALEESLDKVKAFSCGGVDYVTKPFQVDELLARVRAHLKIHQMQKQLEENNQKLIEAQAEKIKLAHDAGMASSANQTKSQFISTMSHELRTPMNGIMGLIDAMLDFDPRQEQKVFLDEMKVSANRLLTIVNDVLEFSNMTAHHTDDDIINFQIQDIFNHLQLAFADDIAQKDLQLLIVTPTLPELRGDLARLQRILGYLVNNAIKFCNDGSITLEAEILQQTDDHTRLRLWVIDTGIGIREAQLAQIFQPFYQVDASITRHHGGTGVGLSIAQQLAEAIEGKIEVQSELGKGSRFSCSAQFDHANFSAVTNTS